MQLQEEAVVVKIQQPLGGDFIDGHITNKDTIDLWAQKVEIGSIGV
jgi:hypothetical protein